MTLRLRLLLLLVGIVAAGLLISDVVTYNALRSFLITRVDQQLDGAAFPVGRALLSTSGLGPQVPAAPRSEFTAPHRARPARRPEGPSATVAVSSGRPGAAARGCSCRREPTARSGAPRERSRPTCSSTTGARRPSPPGIPAALPGFGPADGP